jgi:hypothetical protein
VGLTQQSEKNRSFGVSCYSVQQHYWYTAAMMVCGHPGRSVADQVNTPYIKSINTSEAAFCPQDWCPNRFSPALYPSKHSVATVDHTCVQHQGLNHNGVVLLNSGQLCIREQCSHNTNNINKSRDASNGSIPTPNTAHNQTSVQAQCYHLLMDPNNTPYNQQCCL